MKPGTFNRKLARKDDAVYHAPPKVPLNIRKRPLALPQMERIKK